MEENKQAKRSYRRNKPVTKSKVYAIRLENDSICPNLKCNIKALDRAKVPTIPEKESVREPEKHLPVLCGCTNKNTGFCLCFGSSDRFYFPLSGSNKQSITEANNANRTIRHFFA